VTNHSEFVERTTKSSNDSYRVTGGQLTQSALADRIN